MKQQVFENSTAKLTIMDIIAIIFLIQFILVVIFCFVLLMTAILTIGVDLLLYSFSYISKFNV